MIMNALLAMVLLSSWFSPAPYVQTQTGTLRVKVVKISSDNGQCRFCLFQAPAGFPDDESKAVACANEPIRGGASEHVFRNLPFGRYAVATFHDDNGNGKLDLNFMKIPKEKTGFTNGARIGMTGPPSFEKAAFQVNMAESAQFITLSQ